jgi:hypothetical protein
MTDRKHASSRTAVAILFAMSLVVVLGCSGLKKKKDTGATTDPPVGNAPTVTVGGTGAKNEKDVLRYSNETPLADEPGIIGKDVTKVRAFPQTGGEVATLSKGTTVIKKAKFFSTGVLILFDDPTTVDGTKLLGWIPPEALAAPGTVPTVAPTLTAPKPVVVDAGVKPVVVFDAGAPRTSALLQTLPVAGECPGGFVIVGPFCRRPCSADADCPRPAVCTLSVGSRKTCSATR